MAKIRENKHLLYLGIFLTINLIVNFMYLDYGIGLTNFKIILLVIYVGLMAMAFTTKKIYIILLFSSVLVWSIIETLNIAFNTKIHPIFSLLLTVVTFALAFKTIKKGLNKT